MQPQKPRDLAKLICATEATIRRLGEESSAQEGSANAKYAQRRSCQLRHERNVLLELQKLAVLGAEGKTGVGASDADGSWPCVIA